MIGRHPIRDPHTELYAGVAVFLVGAWLIYDATGRRGRATPKILRPITFW